MLYIFSISLQVSGAIILLLWCFKGMKEDEIIKKYFPGSNIADRDDDNFCILDKNKLQFIMKEALKNVIAFIYIILGYMLTYFSQENFMSPIESVELTFVFSFVIIIIGVCISELVAKTVYKKDLKKHYRELVPLGADTFPTKKEIDDMISGKSSS